MYVHMYTQCTCTQVPYTKRYRTGTNQQKSSRLAAKASAPPPAPHFPAALFLLTPGDHRQNKLPPAPTQTKAVRSVSPESSKSRSITSPPPQTCNTTLAVESAKTVAASTHTDPWTDQRFSLGGLEFNCTAVKKVPTIELMDRFKTTNCMSGRGGGGSNHAYNSDCGTSIGGRGQGKTKGRARGIFFGGVACWARAVPWVFLVLRGMKKVAAVPIPDCTYIPPYQTGWDDRTCGIRQAVDTYTTPATIHKYGPIEHWNTSLVTDMSWVFHSKSNFNANVAAWDVGSVKSMVRSTFLLHPFFFHCGC